MTNVEQHKVQTNESNCKSQRFSKYDNCIEDVEACPGLRPVITEMKPFINADKPILLNGESGSGKEFMARAIHAMSDRADGPFVAANMAAFAPSLLVSELCGHEEGAFTGAKRRKTGLFQSAENGIIFLDEINSISPELQVILLRIVQEREVMPVGGANPVRINCQIILGTNENLWEMVQTKTLRKDLYYRISTLEFTIPPLRDRRVDIPILAKRMIPEIARRKGSSPPGITDDAIMLLIVQHWHGNVRELHNILYYIIYNCHDELITANLVKDVFKRKNLALLSYKEAVAQFHREIIEATLLSTPTITEAAKLLGIGLTTLKEKMKRLEINEK